MLECDTSKITVFISSVISGLENYRDTAEQTLYDFASSKDIFIKVLRSESQTATAQTSIDLCERMVAQSSIVVGIYGHDYGTRDTQTNLSMTHLEFKWAKKYHKPLLAFLVNTENADKDQKQFLKELQDTRFGVFRERAKNPDELKYAIYKALDNHICRIDFEIALFDRYTNIRDKEIYHSAVPLRCTDNFNGMDKPTTSNDPFLKEHVINLLKGDNNVIFILGEAGAGKTWFAKDLFCSLLKQHIEHRTSLPVYIDLSRVTFDDNELKENTEFLLLSKQYNLDRYFPIKSSKFFSLFQQIEFPIVLILDGYDEAVAKTAAGSRLHILETLLKMLNEKTKLIITSRSHLFETEEKLIHLIKTARFSIKSKAKPPRWSQALVFIKSLREDDILEFLKDQYNDTEGLRWSKMCGKFDLRDLAKRPVLLPMVCETLDEFEAPPIVESITAGYLYRIYTTKWLSREKESGRLTLPENSARLFFGELSRKFHNSGVDSIYFSEISEQFPEFFPNDKFSRERDRIDEELRTATFLVNDSEGEYRFIHRSFLEYFLAESIISAIMKCDTKLILEKFPSKVTDEFICDLLMHESGWGDKIFKLLRKSQNKIVRYLMVYLANRLAFSKYNALNANTLAKELIPLLKSEKQPVVIREILVSLISHNIQIEPTFIKNHLANPIPCETIRKELKEYYGSLKEARHYVREKLRTHSTEPLQFLYLISLSAMATEEDKEIFLYYAEHGNPVEQQIVKKNAEKFGKWL